MVHMDRECPSSLKSDYSSSLANDDHHDDIHSRNTQLELENRHNQHHNDCPEDIVEQHPNQNQLDTSHTDLDSIILYPFAHQVGGHTQLLTLDKGTLCKPLIPRELLFYMNVPKELVNFLPSYKGVVQIRENGSGSYPPLLYQPLRSPKSPFARYGPGSSYTLPAKLNGSFLSPDNSQSITDLSGSPLELKVSIRQCSDENILRKNLSEENLLASNFISRPNEKYLLLLENVAAKYQFPCILDLKMGTRQHGEDATEEKRHRQIAKCQASTSASLGVRLCGMQVYQVDHGGFLWYDKYYGRKMNEQGLKQALHQYFYNGFQINKDIIDDVIARLKLLQIAVERSPSFRFYGTSLLIIHEGCTNNRSSSASSMKSCPVDVRLIDFAHTICDYSYGINPNTTTRSRTTTTPTPKSNKTTTKTKNTSNRSSSSPCVLRSSSVELLRSDYQLSQDQQKLECQLHTTDEICTLNVDLNTTQIASSPPPPPLSCQQLSSLRSKVETANSIGDDHQSLATQLPSYNIITDKNALIPNSLVNHHSRSPITKITSHNNNNNNNNNNNINTNDNNNDDYDVDINPEGNQILMMTNDEEYKRKAIQNDDYDDDNEVRDQDQDDEDREDEDDDDDDDEDQDIDENQDDISSMITSDSKKINHSMMGPDKGLLFGLQNLMRLLEDLKEDYQIDQLDQTQAPREKTIKSLYIPVV